MTTWLGYFGIADLALTLEQRAAVIAALDELGPSSDPQPGYLLRRRVSTAADEAIYASLFPDTDKLSVESVKNYLANAVGVNPENIDDSVQSTQYGPLVTYSAGGTPQLQFLVFAGLASETEESRLKCLLFLYNNAADWGEEVQ